MVGTKFQLKDGVTTSKVIDRMGREQEGNILNEEAIREKSETNR